MLECPSGAVNPAAVQLSKAAALAAEKKSVVPKYYQEFSAELPKSMPDSRHMAHIVERVCVRCPYHHAKRCVEGAAGCVAPMPPFVLSFERTRDDLRPEGCLRVRWGPANGEPFPQFDGEIALSPSFSGREALLELRGEYVTPVQMAGEAAVALHMVAGTARSVLRKLADAIEGQAR